MPLKLDSTGDLSRTSGRFDTLDEVTDIQECIGQRIAIRLRRWLGEWSFDTRLGMDWETLLSKGTSEGQLRAAIVREVALVPGVRSIREMAISVSSARVATVTGAVVVAATGEPVTFSIDVGV